MATTIMQILQIQVKVDSSKEVAQAGEAVQNCQFVLFIQTMNNQSENLIPLFDQTLFVCL